MRSQLAIVFASSVIALLIVLSALFAWKQNPAPATQPASASSTLSLESSAGEVRFTHPRHASARCSDCHHPTTDPNPYRACRDCHQKSGSRILNSQQAFHQTCVQCHDRTSKSGQKAPSRRCSSCHQRNSGD